MTTKNNQNYNKEYIEYVKKIAPKTNEARSLFHAFLVGGFICLIGQFIRYFFLYTFGLFLPDNGKSDSVFCLPPKAEG